MAYEYEGVPSVIRDRMVSVEGSGRGLWMGVVCEKVRGSVDDLWSIGRAV